jgi:hypothetical protein
MNDIEGLIEIIERGWQKSMSESHNRNFDQREFAAGKTNQASKAIVEGYEAWRAVKDLLTQLGVIPDESQ